MALSPRMEVLADLHARVQNGEKIPFSKSERKEATAALREATEAYEAARRKLMLYELSGFYRVAIFGGTKLDEKSEEFQFVTKLSKALVEAIDVDIVTGGGPGLMTAANYGARQAIQEASEKGRKLKCRNWGLTLRTLSDLEDPNKHLHFNSAHTEFSTRLQGFLDATDGAYIAQGGIGTLLETAMLAQTIQVGHIERDYPLVAHPYWQPIVDAWNNKLYHDRVNNGQIPLIKEKDLSIIRFSDNIPEIVDIFSVSYDRWMQDIRCHVEILP